jgi:uncharacterized protein YdbL (DUF1318 family)
MTIPWREWSLKGEVGEMAAAATDQINLTANASIPDIAAEVENDQRESVRKLAQAQDVSAKTVHVALLRTQSSQRSRPGG